MCSVEVIYKLAEQLPYANSPKELSDIVICCLRGMRIPYQSISLLMRDEYGKFCTVVSFGPASQILVSSSEPELEDPLFVEVTNNMRPVLKFGKSYAPHHVLSASCFPLILETDLVGLLYVGCSGPLFEDKHLDILLPLAFAIAATFPRRRLKEWRNGT